MIDRLMIAWSRWLSRGERCAWCHEGDRAIEGRYCSSKCQRDDAEDQTYSS